MTAKATRRRFTPQYKLAIVENAELCETPGEIGKLLRREGLVQLASVGVAEGGAGRVSAGAGEEARPEALGREA